MRVQNASFTSSPDTTSEATPASRWRNVASLFAVAALSFGLAACNDEDDPQTPEQPCVGEECETPCFGEECETPDDVKQCLAIATESTDDGALAVLDIESLDIRTDITSTHSDAGFVSHEETLFVINRYGGDNIQALNVTDGFSTIWQYSTGVGSNPQTMAVHGSHGFIPVYGAGKVMIVDLTAETEEDFILEATLPVPPIAAWDGSQGEPANAVAHEGVIYVISQGINDDWSFAAEARSRILAFDAETFAPKAVFEGESYLDLATFNAEKMLVMGDTLYVQSIGTYRAYSEEMTDDGAIEAIDLTTGTSQGVILTETDAGHRDIFQMFPAHSGQGLWVNLAGTEDFNALNLHYLDLSGDTPVFGESVYQGYIWSAHESAEYLFISDRTFESEGIFVLDTATGELISEEPLNTDLPPRDLTPFERVGSCF